VITISRKLKGLIPYRLVWFPSEAELNSLADDLPLTDMARVECADRELERARCMVNHHINLTLCLDLTRPLDDQLAAFDSSARKKVRQAERMRDRIVIRGYDGGAENAGMLDEFVALHNSLVEHKPGVMFPISRDQIERFFPQAQLFLCDFDGKLTYGRLSMLDRDSGKVRHLYAASRRFDDQEASRTTAILNVYLHWHEIQIFRAAGFRVMDLGGISPVDDPGINRFKLQFGGAIVRQHSYLFAGMPMAWRGAFGLFTAFTERGKRRHAVERAGDQWRSLPLNQIQQRIEDACLPRRREPIGDRA
jgi:hypothetical protein